MGNSGLCRFGYIETACRRYLMPPTICCSHSASVSSKAASLRLSMSKTPGDFVVDKTGTTISERTRCCRRCVRGIHPHPVLLSFSSPSRLCRRRLLPKLILSQAGGPTFGPNISHCPFPSDSSSFPSQRTSSIHCPFPPCASSFRCNALPLSTVLFRLAPLLYYRSALLLSTVLFRPAPPLSRRNALLLSIASFLQSRSRSTRSRSSS